MSILAVYKERVDNVDRDALMDENQDDFFAISIENIYTYSGQWWAT